MKVAFDLDGTLDRPVLRDLCLALLEGGHEVHIITGTFTEAIGWQDAAAKREKLARLGIPFDAMHFGPGIATLHVLDAVPQTYSREYRLIDLGLRKGELCERHGVQLVLDDSETYCEMIPKMAGGTQVLHVR